MEPPRTPSPNSNPPIIQSTPYKSSAQSRLAHTSNHFQRDARMVQVGMEMGNRWFGPVEPEKFLERYLPSGGDIASQTEIAQLTEDLKKKLSEVSRKSKEVDMYSPMIAALKDVCGVSLVLVDTHNYPDNSAWARQPDLIKPDITAYNPKIYDPTPPVPVADPNTTDSTVAGSTTRAPTTTLPIVVDSTTIDSTMTDSPMADTNATDPPAKPRLRPNDITKTEFFWEFKLDDNDDGFEDSTAEKDGDESAKGKEKGRAKSERRGREKKIKPFEKVGNAAADTRSQIATYAGATLCSQFRTHLFSVLVTRTKARLVRWDREGAVVTSAFEFAKEPYLVEFVKRYESASEETRGHDPCVTAVVDDDLARKVRAVLGDGPSASYPVYKFTFPNDQDSGNEAIFYGGKIAFEGNACPTGRSTRGFFVVDEKLEKKAYLKDTWRVAREGIEKEGDVYQTLEREGVQKIPGVLASGDAYGDWQRTTAGDFSGKEDEKRRPHQHYFIVLDTIGRPLTSFKTVGEFLNAMKDALQAHYEACEKAKILHRDISIGNILITDDGGILIDWDFSKPLHLNAVRQPERTGTWQFMSAKLLLNTDVVHTIADDLESFYHVLCYVFWKYCKHKVPDSQVLEIMALVFDWAWIVDQHTTGGRVKRKDLRGKGMAGERVAGHLGEQEGLVNLIVDAEEVLGVRYIDPPTTEQRKNYTNLKALGASQGILSDQTVYQYDQCYEKLNDSKWLWERFCSAASGNTHDLKDPPVHRNLVTKPRGRTGNLQTKTQALQTGDAQDTNLLVTASQIDDNMDCACGRPSKKQKQSHGSQS